MQAIDTRDYNLVSVYAAQFMSEYRIQYSRWSGSRLEAVTHPTDDLVYLFNYIKALSAPLYEEELRRISDEAKRKSAFDDQQRARFWGK